MAACKRATAGLLVGAVSSGLAQWVTYLRPALVVTSSGAVVMIVWPRRSSIEAISLRKAERVNDRNASMRGAMVSLKRANSRCRSWSAAMLKRVVTWWHVLEVVNHVDVGKVQVA